jgi:ribonuclease P protein component
MIAKDFRLKRNQIDYLLDKGLSTNTRVFIVRYIQNNKDFPRFCVIISKKIDNRATVRNQLRRQIYESIRITNLLKNLANLDIILIPKKAIISKSFAEIKEDISTLPSKITT